MSNPESVSSKIQISESNRIICKISLRFFSPPENPSLTFRFKNCVDILTNFIFLVTISKNSIGSTSGSFTFTGGGQYTKIGRLVTISVDISNVTFGSYVGNLQFGLPFTSASSNTYYGGDAYYYPQANWDNVSNFIGFTPSAPASSSIGIFQLKTLEGDRQASLTNSNTNTSGQGGLYARFSLTYATA